MSHKIRKISKRGQPCVNHSDIFDTKECERCHQYFCKECYIEDWHETFFQQFIGQKREVVKKIYCKPCQKRVIRVRMIAYIGLLLMFSFPVIMWLFISLID